MLVSFLDDEQRLVKRAGLVKKAIVELFPGDIAKPAHFIALPLDETSLVKPLLQRCDILALARFRPAAGGALPPLDLGVLGGAAWSVEYRDNAPCLQPKRHRGHHFPIGHAKGLTVVSPDSLWHRPCLKQMEQEAPYFPHGHFADMAVGGKPGLPAAPR